MWFELALLFSVAFFILIFFTGLLEKQYIQQFVPADEASLKLSPYYRAVTDSARALGFENLGTFVQQRGSRVYAGIVSFWISPDGRALARIAGGKTAGIRVRRTTLISRMAKDRILETADDFSGGDLSGLSHRIVVMNAHLPELVERHEQRLRAQTGEPLVFPRGNILAVHEEIESAKAERLFELGLAKPLNLQHSIWRYTMKGAWHQYSQGFRRQLAEGKQQVERVKLKRPGD